VRRLSSRPVEQTLHSSQQGAHVDPRYNRLQISPKRLYEAILDQKQFAAFSGMPASIDATPGEAFSQFGGQIVDRSIELVPNRLKIDTYQSVHIQVAM
jgi:activator of HSP90 ATPase